MIQYEVCAGGDCVKACESQEARKTGLRPNDWEVPVGSSRAYDLLKGPVVGQVLENPITRHLVRSWVNPSSTSFFLLQGTLLPTVHGAEVSIHGGMQLCHSYTQINYTFHL